MRNDKKAKGTFIHSVSNKQVKDRHFCRLRNVFYASHTVNTKLSAGLDSECMGIRHSRDLVTEQIG